MCSHFWGHWGHSKGVAGLKIKYLNLIFFLGHQVLPVFILNYDEPGRRQILYLCNLEAHHPQILNTFDIYFMPQKKYLLEKVLRGCHVGKYATFVRLKFWCGFNVFGWFISLATCRSLENQAKTFLMSPRLFSATCELPQHISVTSNLNFSGNDVHQQIQKWQKIGVWSIPIPFN